MIDILKDAFFDSIKLLPFLFIVYLILEFIEHKSNKKTEKVISNSGKIGPVVGSIMGAFPQCGFSVMASNLYIARIISMGTLISIYLSTSDEMLPIMISNGMDIHKILVIILIKVILGMIYGIIIDLIFNKSRGHVKNEITKLCEHDHCNCDENILKSSIKHSLRIFIFVFVINIIMNFIIYLVGESTISNIMVYNNYVGPLLSSFVGLIPNCGASVIITEMFVNGTINFGSLMTGLMVNSGVALIVLFKLNKNMKENLTILGLTYSVSILTGLFINILNISI